MMRYQSLWFVLALFSVYANHSAYSQTNEPYIPISYKVDSPSQVSLLIIDAQGKVVRELLHAAKRKSGAQRELWNGLDENGNPVPAGEYNWKLLATQGIQAQYIMTIGTNTTPQWGAWPGNHGTGSTVAYDSTGMYVATGCGEGTALVIKQTLDGKRLWTIPHWLDAWVGPCSMASDGGQLFMLQLDGKVYRVDADTGKVSEGWNLVFDEDRKASVFNEVSSIMDMDAGAGQLVVSYTRHNLIRWIDPNTGQEIDRTEIPRPSGIAVDRADGSILVISNGSIVRLSRADKQPKQVIAKEQLEGARRLRVSPHTSEIYVIENRGVQAWVDLQYFSGRDLAPDSDLARVQFYRRRLTDGGDATRGQQVKKFDRNGKLLDAFGRPDGRPYGPYIPNDYSGLFSIAVTSDGGFLIGEEGTMKRSAIFDKNGKVVREWFGGWYYGQFAFTDPQDSSTVWIPDRNLFVKCKVDYQRKTWQPLASYSTQSLLDQFGESGQYWRLLRRGETIYFARYGSIGGLGPVILKLDEHAHELIPVAVGNVNRGQDPHLKLAAAQTPVLAQVLKDGPAANSNMWVDMNGDGLSSLDEYKFYDWWTHGSGFYVSDDFTYYFHGQDDNLKAVEISVLPVSSWTDKGVPVYDFAERKVLGPSVFMTESMWQDDQGNLYQLTNSSGLDNRQYGVGFWSPRASANRVSKLNSSGEPLWTVGRHAASSIAGPGEAKYLYTFTGMTHGCIVANDVEDGMMHVWDEDGLWVGRLLESPIITPDSPKEAYELCGENFGGSLHTNPATGDVLFFGGAINNVPVYRITGWDKFVRSHGTVSVSSEVAASLKKRADVEAARSDVIRGTYIEANQLKIDGDLSEWSNGQPVSIKDGDREVAKVYLAWSRDWLYAAFDVNTDSPWKNSGSANMAFQGGAAVDVNLGGLDPQRNSPQPGDLRVVVSPINGQTTAVEYYPVLPTDVSPPHFEKWADYQTLVGKLSIRRVATLPQDWAASKIKPNGQGYIVEMRIPVHKPITLRPRERFRFDASVILSNKDGDRSILRLPWHSRAAADMSTQDTFTEAGLRPQNWGQAVLE